MKPESKYRNGARDLMRRLGEQRLPEAVRADFKALFTNFHPYDLGRRSQSANEVLEKHLASFLPASLERALLLLTILHYLYPTEQVASAYFDNLQGLLQECEPLDREGTVVLGIGTGRCGSTSLAVAFQEMDNALATHETPPMIFWQPQPEQVAFHLRRLEWLCRYYRVVFDASHWWLEVMPAFLERFPGGKVVGLHREMESCVNSFLKIKGAEHGTVNHWAPPDDKRWAKSAWDPSYPSFVAPPQYDDNPFMSKGTQIQWYVDSYNARLHELANRYPEKFLLIHTNSLGEPQVSDELSAFVGARVTIPEARYNEAVMDSMNQQRSFWF
jgi:hypothetical protein